MGVRSPMALRAWLSSKLNAFMGTSSHTGRTATVERLLDGLVTSALVVILGKLRVEPGRQKHNVRRRRNERKEQGCKERNRLIIFTVLKMDPSSASFYLRMAHDPAGGSPESSDLTDEST